jgi:hypothetical protein
MRRAGLQREVKIAEMERISEERKYLEDSRTSKDLQDLCQPRSKSKVLNFLQYLKLPAANGHVFVWNPDRDSRL